MEDCIMKKVFIALAILAAAVFTSCNREKENGYVPKENGIAFYLQGISTKSAETTPQTGLIELDKQSGLIIEESVVSLDDDWYYEPMTKGSPAYTENVASLYGSFNAVAYKSGTTTKALDDAVFTAKDGMWEHIYDITDPLADGELRFFARMPADVIDAQCSSFGYNTDGSIEFNYDSPATATGQRDMLFTSRTLNKAEYKPKQGAALLFHHTLTGVKFRVQNDDDEIEDMGIVITKVVFSGFQTSGHCKVVPNKENNYKDNKEVYSSSTAVTWSAIEGKESIDMSEEFDGMIDYTSTTTSLPEAFYAKDNTHNVNDASASHTFWIIPQALTEGKTITVYFEMNGKKNQYFVLDVTKLKTGVEWKAGDLRTYTIKLNDVNVMIEDDVTIAGSASDGYAGSTKTNVDITNTGNTDAYIRAAIVGQWLDADNNPVFGFTDEINDLYLVESWYEDQFVSTATGKHGTFTGLPGYKGQANPNANGWMLCQDGYYYYTELVPPLATANPASAATCEPLFTEYKVLVRPQAVEIGGETIDVSTMHFELEIATQAISAKKLDGGTYTWQEAWANALGEAPVKKQ